MAKEGYFGAIPHKAGVLLDEVSSSVREGFLDGDVK